MTPTSDKHVAALTILQRAVCLTLSRHYLGNDRKVALADVVDAAAPERPAGEMAIDADQFKVTKKLIPQKLLTPVMHALYRPEVILRKLAIAGHRIFGDRTYLIPLDLVAEADAELERCAADVWIEAGKLADGYEAAMDAQEAAIGPKLFKRAEYPTKAQVRSAFSIDWDYVSFAAPERLETVSHALAQRANRKHEERLAGAYDEVVHGLRSAALDVFIELDERLDVGTGERPRTLRGTALRDLEEFARYLPKRNIGDDDRLAAVVARVAERAAGVTVEQLRDDAGLRTDLQAAVAEAKAVLAGLVEDAPRRGLTFGRIGAAA